MHSLRVLHNQERYVSRRINCYYMAKNPAPKPRAIIQAKTNCPPDVTARAFALLCALALALADADADATAADEDADEASEERAPPASEEMEEMAEAAAELAEDAIEAAPPARLLLRVSESRLYAEGSYLAPPITAGVPPPAVDVPVAVAVPPDPPPPAPAAPPPFPPPVPVPAAPAGGIEVTRVVTNSDNVTVAPVTVVGVCKVSVSVVNCAEALWRTAARKSVIE